MSEDQKKNNLNCNFGILPTSWEEKNADEFRDYILGFIFYKYLAEKMEIYANVILKPDGIKYKE